MNSIKNYCWALGFLYFCSLSASEIGVPEQYQDIIINNVVTKPGIRECEQRYQALIPILQRYKRPITVLDLGASQGYFSFRIAHDYDATCAMIEGNYNEKWHIADQLLELCKKNTNLSNIIFLKRKITVQELRHLSTCEHFDVVLAFNIVHHFGLHWKEATDAITNMGDNIIFETPPAQDSISIKMPWVPAIEKYLLEQKGIVIAEVPRHTDPTLKGKMIWLPKHKTTISRVHWLLKEAPKVVENYRIESSYKEKYLYKKRGNKKVVWKKGINLLTFQMLQGVYPEKKLILEKMVQLAKYNFNDFMPWNIIIQGNELVPIDQDDERWKLDPVASLAFSLNLMEHDTPETTLAWFHSSFGEFLKKQGLEFNPKIFIK